MSLKVENIKKFMGWCPNARVSEARQNASFENFNSENPQKNINKLIISNF